MISYYVNLLEDDLGRERFIRIYQANHQRMSRLAGRGGETYRTGYAAKKAA